MEKILQYTVKQLKNEIKKNNIPLPDKGSGRSGRFVKFDYQGIVHDWFLDKFYSKNEELTYRYKNHLILNKKELLKLISDLNIKLKYKDQKYTRKELVNQLKMYKHKRIKEILSRENKDEISEEELIDAEMFNIPTLYKEYTYKEDTYKEDILTRISFSQKKIGKRVLNVPIEILVKILSPLDLRVIYNFCTVNKSFAKFCNERLWRHMFHHKMKLPGIFIPGTWTNLIKKPNIVNGVNHFELYMNDLEANREHKTIIKEIIKTSKHNDFFNFEGHIDEKIWKEIAREKLGIIKLGKFNSWEELNKIMTYKDHDLYTLWNKYKFGLLTKTEAEESIIISDGRDKYGRLSPKTKYKTVLYRDTNFDIYYGAERVYRDLYVFNIDKRNDWWMDDINGWVFMELSEEGIKHSFTQTKNSLIIERIYVHNYRDLLGGY